MKQVKKEKEKEKGKSDSTTKLPKDTLLLTIPVVELESIDKKVKVRS